MGSITEGARTGFGAIGAAIVKKREIAEKRQRELQSAAKIGQALTPEVLGRIGETNPGAAAFLGEISTGLIDGTVDLDSLSAILGEVAPSQPVGGGMDDIIFGDFKNQPVPESDGLGSEPPAREGGLLSAEDINTLQSLPAGNERAQFIMQKTGLSELPTKMGPIAKVPTREDLIKEAQAAAIKESFKQQQVDSDKLTSAIAIVDDVVKEWNKAFPSGERTAAEQRLAGIGAIFGTATGLTDNPEFVALRRTARSKAVQLVKKFGDVGNIAEKEQKEAAKLVDLPTLTDEERNALAKMLIQSSIAQITIPEIRQEILSRPSIQELINLYSVEVGLDPDSAKFEAENFINQLAVKHIDLKGSKKTNSRADAVRNRLQKKYGG